MDIGKRALNLATGLVLGASIMALSAEPAAAETKKPPKDNGVRCSATGATVLPPSDNDYEFYMPGEYADLKDPSGAAKLMQCQADGTWKAVRTANPLIPGQVPGHTFGQTP